MTAEELHHTILKLGWERIQLNCYSRRGWDDIQIITKYWEDRSLRCVYCGFDVIEGETFARALKTARENVGWEVWHSRCLIARIMERPDD